MKNKIIISNGFSKYPLANLASQLHKQKLLKLLITGFYPFEFLKKMITYCKLDNFNSLKRFALRSVGLNRKIVKSLFLSETIYFSNVFFRKLKLFSNSLRDYGFYHYQENALKLINSYSHNTSAYLYRAGFGGSSVRAAKKLGIKTICYHGGAHPLVESYAVNNYGALPKKSLLNFSLKGVDQLIDSDLKSADYVIGEGQWSCKSIIYSGIKSDKVFEIQRGSTFSYLRFVQKHKEKYLQQKFIKNSPLEVVYAGTIGLRKGTDILIKIIKKIKNPSIRFTIIGDDSLAESYIKKKLSKISLSKNVNYIKYLSHEDLTIKLLQSHVFIFPSKSEGCPRVIDEACAAGAYPIMSKNVGTFVKNNFNGKILGLRKVNNWVNAINSINNNRKTILQAALYNMNICKNKYNEEYFSNQFVSILKKINEKK